MNILIVEEDNSTRRLLETILSPYGNCRSVDNGKEALEAFKKSWEGNEPYNLICLDIMLSVITGPQVLQEIRRWEEDRNINNNQRAKIIMVSGLSDPKDIIRSFKYRCDDFIIKPINRRKLIDKVQKLSLVE